MITTYKTIHDNVSGVIVVKGIVLYVIPETFFM